MDALQLSATKLTNAFFSKFNKMLSSATYYNSEYEAKLVQTLKRVFLNV